MSVQRDTILLHLEALHRLYGEGRGVRVGRKHLTWYCKYLKGAEEFRHHIVRVESAKDQLLITAEFLDQSEALQKATDPTASNSDYLPRDKKYFQKESFLDQQEG
jgi:hypothetical protein